MTFEPDALLSPAELDPAVALARRVLDQMDRILLGRAELHRMTLIGILARGHILLEGLPGLGKTALIKALADLLQLEFKRIQFTPDLMPSDILGAHILQEDANGRRAMTFQPGPVFTNILLADEINRASPKTQSAMLETMQEHAVTLLGTTRPLPEPFFVLASQNPIELEGTYPLPEAQVDRFLFKLNVDSVPADVLSDIISTRRHGTPPTPDWTLPTESFRSLMAAVERVFLPRPVARYIARLTAATHPNGATANEQVRQYVTYGASPRAAIGMAEAARAHALVAGHATAGFEDVRHVATAVLNHRIILNYKARFDGADASRIVKEILTAVPETDMNLPADLRVEDPAP